MKPKQKTAANSFSHFWNEVLFKRVFEFEIALTADQCADEIHHLKSLAQHTRFHKCRYETAQIDGQHYTFQVVLQRNPWNSLMVVEGAIQQLDHATRISGIGRLPRWEPLLAIIILIIALLASMSIASMPDKTLWNLFLLISGVFYFALMIWERDQLIDFIYSSLKQRETQARTGDEENEHDEIQAQSTAD